MSAPTTVRCTRGGGYGGPPRFCPSRPDLPARGGVRPRYRSQRTDQAAVEAGGAGHPPCLGHARRCLLAPARCGRRPARGLPPCRRSAVLSGADAGCGAGAPLCVGRRRCAPCRGGRFPAPAGIPCRRRHAAARSEPPTFRGRCGLLGCRRACSCPGPFGGLLGDSRCGWRARERLDCPEGVYGPRSPGAAFLLCLVPQQLRRPCVLRLSTPRGGWW